MTSPCFRHPYGFDLDIVKSPSTSTRTSNTSSPSSTLSESSNCLSTRKPRTPRKRPNQTYNEAAALLSTAYPKIFSPKNLSHPSKFSRPHHFLDEPPPELLWPLRLFDEDSGFLLHQAHPEKPSFFNEAKVSSLMNYTCKSDSNSVGNSSEFSQYEDDFDAESILDEEIEQGIDSIMGNLSVSKEDSEDLGVKDGKFRFQFDGKLQGFGNGIMRKGVRAFRQRNDGNWWCFPIVDMLQISPRLSNKVPDSDLKPKLKLKSVAKLNSGDKKKSKVAELKNLEPAKEKPEAEPSAAGLMLKLNYDGVLDAWSDRGSPYSDEFSGADDASERMAQIEMLFGENGVREASVLRYKEKRRTRLFSKKIRYQVRKVNADQRPRVKGRFVRRPHSSACSQRREED